MSKRLKKTGGVLTSLVTIYVVKKGGRHVSGIMEGGGGVLEGDIERRGEYPLPIPLKRSGGYKRHRMFNRHRDINQAI